MAKTNNRDDNPDDKHRDERNRREAVRHPTNRYPTFAQAIVAEKIKDNRFRIKNNSPNVEVGLLVGAEEDRTPDLRIANGTIGYFMDDLLGLENSSNFAENLNKNAAANKISTTMNYDIELPILMNFGNGVATAPTGASMLTRLLDISARMKFRN